MNKLKFIVVFMLLAVVSQEALAQQKSKNFLKNTKLSGKGFIAYDYNDNAKLHNFSLQRGYITVKSKISNVFSFRYTQDITLDRAGGDMGNLEIRVKYLYMRANLGKVAFLTNNYIEVGLTHVPWIIFEQTINPYRPQGLMFVDRNKIFTSADFGVELAGLIGGKMDEDYRKNVNKYAPGRYGSYAVGVFNGGGFHAIEKNSNKTVRSRLTLRPLPDFVPGLQISHGFTYGKSNIAKSDTLAIPDAMGNVFMLSSESRYHKFTAQYLIGSGSYTGNARYLDDQFKSADNEGFSVFGQFLVPKTGLALFGRYDYFKLYKTKTDITETIIGGVSYKYMNNMLMLAYQQIKGNSRQTINYYKLALEVNF